MPRLATDRFLKAAPFEKPNAPRIEGPLALFTEQARGLTISAVNAKASAAGITPGMSLTDAQALTTDLTVAPHDETAVSRTLTALAAWTQRYSPSTAPDGADGLWLDITGCAHLFGGEHRLLADLHRRLTAAGFSVRAAIADTLGAAWGAARYAPDATTIIPAGQIEDSIADLPVAALRLPPEIIASLHRVGLATIADLCRIPRPALRRRFPALLLAQLDRMRGHLAEPLAPLVVAPPLDVRLVFAEPISTLDDLAACSELLIHRLCARLAAVQQGARQLRLTMFRTDGTAPCIEIGTHHPSRAPAHLKRLFALRLETIDPGFGIDLAVLTAAAAEPLIASQSEAWDTAPRAVTPSVSYLFDRLSNRFGAGAVLRIRSRDTHIPERAAVLHSVTSPISPGRWPRHSARPLSLLRRPQPIDAVTLANDASPSGFRWRRVSHRVVHVEGPERIEAEWWWRNGPPRDYYYVEDQFGRRFWLYRQSKGSADSHWYIHGLFA